MIITKTPFRISFFGGGTDYPDWFREHGGAVLATSIDKYCYLSVRYLPPFFEHKHRIVYSQVEMVRESSDIRHPVVRAMLEKYGVSEGLEIHHDGDLPARSGLGSSSSFAVGLYHALCALRGKMVSKGELAREAMHIEQDILQEAVGCQDQISAAFGGFNRIDFHKNGDFEVNPVLIDNERLCELEDSMMLFFTGRTRIASSVAHEKIKNFDKKQAELTAMREMVDEAQSILGASGDMVADFGRLLNESWKYKRGLAASVTDPTIDAIYDLAIGAGAYGGKLLGAGGGGFMVFVVPRERKSRVQDALKALVHVTFKFENGGSKVLVYEMDHNRSSSGRADLS